MSIFDAASFWKEFRHGTALVDGVRLHYVEGGSGAPVLLIPGWPQSCYAWRLVMPLLTWLFHAKAAKPWAIGPADLDEYVRVLAAPGAMRAALSYYRAAFSPEGLAQSRRRAERKLTMPVPAFGAEHGVGQGLMDTLRPIANDVRGGVLAGCGHYMPEEYPEAVGNELLQFFKTTDR
jgi:pimeloyl-ACP methyl ester carboxylesterase